MDPTRVDGATRDLKLKQLRRRHKAVWHYGQHSQLGHGLAFRFENFFEVPFLPYVPYLTSRASPPHHKLQLLRVVPIDDAIQ